MTFSIQNLNFVGKKISLGSQKSKKKFKKVSQKKFQNWNFLLFKREQTS
jgi:hypothetical protein